MKKMAKQGMKAARAGMATKKEIPGDVMPGTQRAYPALKGGFGGKPAFAFKEKRPR